MSLCGSVGSLPFLFDTSSRRYRVPFKPGRPCRHIGCPALTRTANGFCDRHKGEVPRRPDDRPSSAARGYGAQWRRVRAAHLKAHPYCVDCGRAATDVDHNPRYIVGTDHRAYLLLSKCHKHHSEKTASEDGGFGNRVGGGGLKSLLSGLRDRAPQQCVRNVKTQIGGSNG